MKFMYNGRIYNPVNVEKKLKKLGITMNDIEIIPEDKKQDNELDDFYKDKEKVIVRSTEDDIRRVCFVQIGTRPPISDILEKQKWNGKTGIKSFTNEYFMTMYYE